MALTLSKPFPIGTTAPDFTLPDTISGKNLSSQELRGNRGTVIFFICNHCPFVIHINDELVRLAKDYQEKGISFIAISSNDIENYPQDSPSNMKKVAQELGYPFPYLYDESQETARAYNAACTPDFYIFDENLKSVYHGQLDDSRPGNDIPVNGNSLREALDELLNNHAILEVQKPSIGCSIKWKK